MSADMEVLDELFISTLQMVQKLEERALSSGPLEDLSVTEIHTIEAIGLGPGRSMGDISTQLFITTATLTTAIHKLFRKGYVQRARDDDDRRIVRITLTRNGRRAYRLHHLYHERLVRSATEELSDEERLVLIHAMMKLKAFFSREANQMERDN